MRIGTIITLAATALAAAQGMPASAGERAALPRALGDTDFREVSMARVELGRLLFYDPVLSGNRNISCATCHHPDFATGDGLSLAFGEGGVGLGPARRAADGVVIEERVPRNSQPLFNLGANEFASMFHDGRVEFVEQYEGGLRNPLFAEMASGFDGILGAQSMFPVVSPDEMAGHYSENEISNAVRRGDITGPDGAWARIAARLRAIPEYVGLFRAAFDDIDGAEGIDFVDAANAVGEFVAFEWRADQSPFDRYLRGDGDALSAAALRGLDVFYGKGGCAACHSGPLQTDHDFHAIAMPQIGPGKSARFETHTRDVGRLRVTGREEDAYRFRTPSLRNVAETAPYGHDGAYATLEAVVRHHLDPEASLAAYDRTQAVLARIDGVGATDFDQLDTPQEMAKIAAANELGPVDLGDDEVADLLAFLESLTDRGSLDGRLGVPEQVPSGLPLDPRPPSL